MTDQERNQVLKMIEDGKITPEEGLQIMQALEQEPDDMSVSTFETTSESETSAPEVSGTETTPEAPPEKADFESDPRLESLKNTVRRLWQIPLWVGIAITVLSAFGMYAVLHAAGMNFWFYFLLLPLLLGVALTALAVGSRRARWLFVDVQQKPGERPGRIFLGFPMPLKLTAWFLRTFGPHFHDLRNTNVDEVIQIIESGFTGDEPLIVNVDEGSDGERVKVFIG
jgi:hypothetical protein